MFEPQRKAIPTEQRVAKTNAGAWCSESRIAFQNGFMKIYGSSDKEMFSGLGPGQSM
jgi:hypothetical protein